MWPLRSMMRGLTLKRTRPAASKPHLQALARKGTWRRDINGEPVAKAGEAAAHGRRRSLAHIVCVVPPALDNAAALTFV